MSQQPKQGRRPRETSPRNVRDLIARAILDPPNGAQRDSDDVITMGAVTLLPHQADAVARLRAMLRELHVALLADDVGLGKTFVALALTRDYPETLVIAPAALLPMWRSAIARVGGTNIRIESMHRFSGANPPRSPARHTLVIVDEAHHLRTPTTRRYHAVAEAVSGCDLLLLSATPVHNTPRDLRAILAIAIGAHAERLDDALLSRVIVRRTHFQAVPVVRERPPLRMPHDASVLDGILRLPAPLPAHEGAVAGALVRLGLLRAWCSSDAALAHTLRKRLLRGEALRHALEGGRHPTNIELRAWLVGDHEVQLAFPQLMAGHAPETGPLLEVLGRHLDAVSALLERHVRTANGDAARAQAMREIMRAHSNTPVIAFSQYAETVQAVGRALSDIAGVGVLTGRRAWIASGAISRQDALSRFAPVAQGRPPPPSHQRIRLLLTTDLLSEGVNLQDAGVVVHLDLPWTDALRRQRVGRCARVGSPHPEVVVYRFEPPQGAESVMRLHARLQRKARWSQRLIGALREETPSAGFRRSAADAATEIRTVLASWLTESLACQAREVDSTRVLVAAAASDVAGFIAVIVRSDGTPILVGGRELELDGHAHVRVSSSPMRLLPLLLAHADLSSAMDVSPRALAVVKRTLRRWMSRQSLAVDLGDAESFATGAHRHAHAALTREMHRLSATGRLRLKRAFHDAFDVLERARGVAAEHALRDWIATREGRSLDEWLQAWRRYAVLTSEAARGDSDVRSPHRTGPTRYSVRALLLYEPIVLRKSP